MTENYAMILIEDLNPYLADSDLKLWEVGGQSLFPIMDPGGSYKTSFCFFVYRTGGERTIKALGIEVPMMDKVAMSRHPSIATELLNRILEQFDKLGVVLKEGDPLPTPVKL